MAKSLIVPKAAGSPMLPKGKKGLLQNVGIGGKHEFLIAEIKSA